MANVLMGQIPGSDKFGPAPVETKRPIDQPPFPGGGAQANSGGPSRGGGAKVGDKYTVLETDLGGGGGSGTKIDTRESRAVRPGEEAEDARRRLKEMQKKNEIDTTSQTDNNEEPAPAINNTLLIAGGLALLYFFMKRKK